MIGNRTTSAKPTVAHVVLGLNVGGLERVVVNLVCGLRDRFRPLVICLEEGGEFQAELERQGISVRVLGKRPGIDWGAIRKLAAIFREEEVRVVHTHNPAPHFHGVVAARLAGVPVRVHTKHGRNYPKDRKKVWTNRIASWLTDVIVPVSDDARDVVLQVERVNTAKVHRIWNGVDTDIYRPEGKFASRPLVIGTVARLSPEKDQRTLLAAFQLVLKQVSNARLVFVGDGPSATELKSLANTLGIADHVDFLGERSDIPAQLNTFGIFALSSVTEGLSMTLLEAMAAALPIVATDVGGNRELVNPPACGLIVPPRSPEALADACLDLLRTPGRCAEMGAAGRARVVERFSLRQMISQYVELYANLLAARCQGRNEPATLRPGSREAESY